MKVNKERLNPFPDEFSLSKEDKQEIIRNATSIAGHTHSESNQSLEVYEFEIGSKVKAIQCGVDKITAAAIGPNGQIALTGTSTGVVAFWDLKEGAVLSQMPSHKDRIVLVAVSLDGKRAISGASDGTVVLWDCETASAVRSLNVLNDAEEYAVGHLAASPDCRFLGVGMSGSLRLLDLQTDAVPKEIQCRDYLGIQTMDISADGKNVLTCSLGGRLTLWNSETGMEPKSLKAHIAYPALARFTSDPSYAVSAAMDATIKLWNLKSNFNSQITQGHSSVVTAVVACADERHLVSGSMDGTLKLWDLKSVLEVDTVQEAADEHGYRDRITALAMASNGQYAVYAVRDRGLELRIFKRLFKRHKKSDRFAEETEVWIAKRWELKLGSKVWALIPWHSKWDKKLVNFSNIDTLHKMLQHVKNHFAKIKKERPHHLFSFYPVDMYLDLLVIELITGKSGIEKIKELDKYTYAMLWGFVRYVLDYHHEPITALALDRKGERLVTASEDTTLKVWDLNPGRLLHTLEGHSDSITDVQLMPDQEHAVSSSNDGTVKLWSLSSDQPLRDLQGHTGGVNAVVVTQNGQYVISGSDDHTIKVWNVDTHAEMCCYELHSGGVLALAVSPNGRYVISSSRDRTVKLWDLMSGQVVASFMGDGLVTACTFSQDGLIVIAGEQSGQMHFLRLQGIQ